MGEVQIAPAMPQETFLQQTILIATQYPPKHFHLLVPSIPQHENVIPSSSSGVTVASTSSASTDLSSSCSATDLREDQQPSTSAPPAPNAAKSEPVEAGPKNPSSAEKKAFIQPSVPSGSSGVKRPVVSGLVAPPIKKPRPLSKSTRSELSMLMRHIHDHMYEKGKPFFSVMANRKLNEKKSSMPDQSDQTPAPTCDEILEAFSISAERIPDMSVEDVAAMANHLFGSKHPELIRTIEKEQVDGSALLLFNLADYRELLQFPLGPAVTLHGIVRRVRDIRAVSSPESNNSST